MDTVHLYRPQIHLLAPQVDDAVTVVAAAEALIAKRQHGHRLAIHQHLHDRLYALRSDTRRRPEPGNLRPWKVVEVLELWHIPLPV